MVSSVRLVPLGGLGEIGMNCMALESEGTVVVLDCGITFPDTPHGVNIIHPAFDYLYDREADVRAVVITHGHEDHIGALPYLLRDIALPVYSPPYALELIRSRLDEHQLDDIELIETKLGAPFEIGPFTFETIRVTHSIADATALAIGTPAGRLVHTGDFKIEARPTDGEHFDEGRFRELGDEGVRLLLSDSTNALVEGRAGEEDDVASALHDAMNGHEGRLVAAVFASNMHRLRSLFSVAERQGRKVALLGRSVQRHVETGLETGYLKFPSSILVPRSDARDVPRDELLVIATGTQAEPPAALARLARGDHPDLRLEPGDRVLLSSRIIPGNERPVYDLINRFERQGISVRSDRNHPGLHVSGHAHRDEQREMIRLVRPAGFLPVHGTYLHLQQHAELARAEGVEQTLVVENGAVVELTDDRLEVVDRAPTGRVHIDSTFEEVTPEMLRDRRTLGSRGVVFVTASVDQAGHLTGMPVVTQRGVLADDVAPDFLRDAADHVASVLRNAADRGIRNEDTLRERAESAVRRFIRREVGRRPLCDAVILRQ